MRTNPIPILIFGREGFSEINLIQEYLSFKVGSEGLKKMKQSTELLDIKGSFSYSHILYFIPVPQILIWSEELREDIKSICFGDSIAFMKWFTKEKREHSKVKRNFSSFIKTVGPLKFNSNNLPIKYREQFKIYCYQQRDSFHPPYPIFTTTQHNDWSQDIRKAFQIINPALRFEIYPLGFIVADFSFITREIPIIREMSALNRSLLKYLKSIKLSLLNALFPKTVVPEVFTQILPEIGYILTISKIISEVNPPKRLAILDQGKFMLYQYTDYYYVIKAWKLSSTINKDVFYPYKWVTALASIYEVFTSKIIEWLQSDDFDSRKYEELWIASAQSLNPSIHYPSFGGRSPLFPRGYQRKLFQKISRQMLLEERYKNFIKSLKHQGTTFAPLAHHAIINLERNRRIDQRLKLLTGIRSNVRRCRVYGDIDLSEIEEKILEVLTKQFEQDYIQFLREMNIGTNEMGWLVLRHLGNRMGWPDYKIYESSDFNLKRHVKGLHEKGLIEIKTQSKGRQRFVRINTQNEIIKSRLSKVVYRVNT
ncbi:MAG: hypothetical protein ACTSW1_05965 [Candidatus Hodarchaeales archaeon]